ncbi:AtpZ/AtpI family protein [Senegalia massiliensis]|uniref:AtpZ/AtpI family protein n=1 Tax=Senegalia massiliensis TaxID=1720316 RepID=A0A845QY21_9CLOT|nr:AtpZ/AtpI family protein [Senegalia massiliensis]NBI06038.1 AtpZ/AtpI family protein [Senegalia massiliensis]
MSKKSTSKALENIALITQIGISMAVPIIGSIFLGNFLDKKLGTNILFLIVFLILGVGAAFMTLFKMTSRMSNRK